MEPLSLEEFMFALIREGQPAVAATVVARMRRAGMTTSAMLACLRTVQHSLVARGLLDPRSDILEDELRHVVHGMAHASTSVGCRTPEAAAYFYLGPEGAFEQLVEHDVRHTLREIDGADAALDRAVLLFDIHEADNSSPAEFHIVGSAFDAIKALKNGEVARTLENAGVSGPVAAAFAEDLAAPRFRGDVVHATHDDDGRPRVDGGLLVLGGQRRTWLVRPDDDAHTEAVTVIHSTAEVFRREAAAFLTFVTPDN